NRQITYPRDHWCHPEFKDEWWYVTGHLFAEQGRRFGFQATFFRRAGPILGSATNALERSPLFQTGPIHLAHMAILDVTSGRFLHQERLNRQGWDAESSTNTLSLRNGNWSLHFANEAGSSMMLRGGVRSEVAFELALTPVKPLVIFGETGVSRKGSTPSASSHYLTFPRLAAVGSVRIGETSLAVTGTAWMDHEISSSQLEEGQAGWDWAGVQLNDGREFMTYRLRRKDGSTDPFSTLAWIDKAGRVSHRNAAQFQWKSLATWKSPKTGAVYPIRSRLTTVDPATGQSAVFVFEPLAVNQELTGDLGGIAYWEGATRVRNDSGQEIGSAFVEMTGYAGNLAERFR
ncbi:MAG: carotenoid 1,2-hydratase, partial [Opitutaceae bacterium]|nr:carotenoid 1,2-hydratase [Verrucomicrobiales bacterium]